jgi:trimethylamine--corrinoid protein Co-methyltransferase
MDSGTLLKMQVAIEHGLPFIFSNYSMIGATTPFTPAGSLALLMAELLAGVIISQVMRPGAMVSVGMLPAYFDMKSMLNFYDPQSVLLNLACAEMMAHYNLPHCGSSGSGTGWGMDLVAADSYWMNTQRPFSRRNFSIRIKHYADLRLHLQRLSQTLRCFSHLSGIRPQTGQMHALRQQ